ncbi:DNA-directed RNA polymerase, mitochondrial [Leucoagaricus sp. SymC.cos]|nr:DNA-directed RNA polymerase, mitochondrial [Leucoagaricus sp. SymC.cos]
MTMLPRAVRRLETSLLLSRQALPRPARLYSTPSRPSRSPGLAAQQVPQTEIPYPTFLNVQPKTKAAPRPEREERILNDLERFLVRDKTYTVLPPPPSTDSSTRGDTWFADNTIQESMSIMDACLHNLFDVPRAKVIFSQLRLKASSSLLETGVYNAFIEAYFGMAIQKDVENEDRWLEDIHDLYEVLETEAENSAPSMMTYGLMLRVWKHFNSQDPEMPRSRIKLPNPTKLLEKMHKRRISPTLVVAETVFNTHEEATEAIKTFSQAALDLNIPDVIAELGQAEALATSEDAWKDVPEVMPVMREAKFDKEGNLIAEAEVPFNITQLRRHLTEVNQTRRVLPEDVMARQKHLEKSAYDVALERLQQQNATFEEIGLANPALNNSTLQKWMWDWHCKLRVRIEKEIAEITKKEKDYRPPSSTKRFEFLSPFLLLVKAERLSLITILEIMRLQGSGGLSDGMKTTRALVSVGKAIEMEYKAQMQRKHPSKDVSSANASTPAAQTKLSSPPPAAGGMSGKGDEKGANDIYSRKGYKCLQERRIAVAKSVEQSEEWTASWSQYTRSKIGGILVDCLMDVAEVERSAVHKRTGETLTEIQPAFFHAYEYLRGNKLGVIRLNPVVVERLAKDQLKDTLHPRHLPMLVRPQPWISHNVGGYLFSKTQVMRYKDSMEQQIYLREASKNGQFELVYAGLDVLGSTPWRINRKVFDVVVQVWNSGERIGKLPPAQFDKPEPEIPENYGTDMKARSVFLQRQKAYNQQKANTHSERCSVNYRLEIARALLNDTFYFPHNLDFRGRAYPIPAHLNHIGDDLCRGLLTFGESKKLGERGLRWLKIHLANLYGYDKANFNDRVRWVDDHIDRIYETATNPLGESRWWLSAGDPWQFLAASIELHEALESGDPYNYESSLPVHQDGTCNGLQHYAALGGDVQGAKQVNLEASDKPSDVYSHVGRMVEEVIDRDVLKGEKNAILLQGKITRKVVKQTVMTTVYGVTYVGAREQIEKQLKDRNDIPEEECWNTAAYLTHVVLGCIGDLFKGAKAIQIWLSLCARIISKSIPEERIPELMAEYLESPEDRQARQTKEQQQQLEVEAQAQAQAETKAQAKKHFGRPSKTSLSPKRNHRTLPIEKLKKEQMTSVIWTTALGLPIVQPYRKTAKKQIKTALQTVYISDPNSLAEVNAVKQASAFPPNYIHSLDATHMILTALECRKNGLTFASVHDSYWTHAADIDQMSTTIRETFIALHSSDILGELYREFLQRYKNFKVPLINLSGSALISRLYNAGSRIYATPEQAKSLAALKELVVVTQEGGSTVDESRAVKDENAVKQLLEDLSSTSTKKSKAASAEASEEEEDVSEDGEAKAPAAIAETGYTKAARDRKEREKEAVVQLMGKFVNLSDLFPPLPQKGEFDVGNIKKSEYFFS